MSTNKPKKIKLLVAISDFRIGGAQKIVLDVLKSLDVTRFEIHLVTFFATPNESTFFSELPDCVEVHSLSFNNFYDLRSWRALFGVLKTIKPEVVWSHLFFSHTVVRTLKVFFGYKVITVEHNTYPNKKWLHRIIDRILATFTYRIVAVAPGVVDFLVREVGIKRGKCVVIQNGVDLKQLQSVSESEVLKARASLGLGATEHIVITVGQLIRQKNQGLLIEAFAQFVKKHTDYKLVIIGEGAKRSELEAQIKALGLESKVLLAGIKKPVAPFLATADFFVLPSLFEGFGIVCIEAMALGLPVIATKVTGPDVYIREGYNGYFCEPTVVSLLEKMEQLTSLDTSAQLRLAAEAKETAASYDISQVSHKYQVLFIEATTG
ncbi:MAG: glycosyltransferase [Patescibacteria group bacterium]